MFTSGPGKSHFGFIYDRIHTAKVVKKFYVYREGGAYRTAKELITSDGTSTLRFRDPATSGDPAHRG